MREILEKKGFICDMDGVIYHGNKILDGVADFVNWLIENDVPFIVVTTKTDKLSATQLKAALDNLNKEYFDGTGVELIPFSSVTRLGKDEVWNKIFESIG